MEREMLQPEPVWTGIIIGEGLACRKRAAVVLSMLVAAKPGVFLHGRSSAADPQAPFVNVAQEETR
jgi:hypothetical protein